MTPWLEFVIKAVVRLTPIIRALPPNRGGVVTVGSGGPAAIVTSILTSIVSFVDDKLAQREGRPRREP